MSVTTFLPALRRNLVAAGAAVAIGLTVAQPLLAQSAVTPMQGPASVADLAEGLLGSVVNISTSQRATGPDAPKVTPRELPEGSPLQDFFD